MRNCLSSIIENETSTIGIKNQITVSTVGLPFIVIVLETDFLVKIFAENINLQKIIIMKRY